MNKLKVAVTIFVGGIWAVAFVMGMITQDYVALGATTPAVMVIVGAIFAIRNGNGNGGRR